MIESPDYPEARVFGRNPFPNDDPRHDAWLSVARFLTEGDARLQAELLRKQIDAPNFSTLVVELMTGRFDLLAMALVATVGHSCSAAACHEGLDECRARLLSWLEPKRVPTWIRKNELIADVRLQLLQRSKYWVAEALRAERQAGTRERIPEASSVPAIATTAAAIDRREQEPPNA